MHNKVAELRSCATQVAAASARKEAAATAAAAEGRAQAADTAAASLRARLDQTSAEVASAITSGQESSKVPHPAPFTCAIPACCLALQGCRNAKALLISLGRSLMHVHGHPMCRAHRLMGHTCMLAGTHPGAC